MNFQDIIREVYDGSQKALKTTASLSASTVYVGTPTLFAVVNTTASSGLATVDIRNTVAVTVGSGVTVFQGGTWTVTQASAARTITGNITLSDAKTYIGLTTTTIGNSPVLGSGVGSIGFATVAVSNSVPVTGTFWQATQPISGNVGLLGNVTLSDSKTYIGLVTAILASNSGTVIGDVRAAGSGGVLLQQKASTNELLVSNVGNITVSIAGTTKTLVNMPFAFSTTSVATIAVATGGGAIFKITSLLASANATTRVSLKSGATYLTGNASIGVSLAPNGGWVESGSVDAPVYIGLASGSAIVVEKNDVTTSVGGKIIYYQE